MRGFIRRRSKGSWEVTIELGTDPLTGKRRRKTQNVKGTRRDAERVQAALVNAVATGLYVEPGRETVAGYLERWLRDYAETAVAPRTLLRYQQIVRGHLIPALGSLRLAALRPAHIAAAERAWLEDGRVRGGGALSRRTVLHHHRVLRESLQQAVRWQLIPRNPADAVEAPRPAKPEMRILDREQAQRLLEAAGGSEFETLILTAIHTGLRLGELLGLRWGDVDLVARSLHIQQTLQRLAGGEIVFGQPKTHRSRRNVSIPTIVADVLYEHRKRQVEARLAIGAAYESRDLVFADELGGPVNQDRLRRGFYRLLRTADLPRLRLHDLRHTMASLMLAQGVHPKIVSERLGHATVTITLDTYSHVLPNLQAEAAEQLAAWIGSSSSVLAVAKD